MLTYQFIPAWKVYFLFARFFYTYFFLYFFISQQTLHFPKNSSEFICIYVCKIMLLLLQKFPWELSFASIFPNCIMKMLSHFICGKSKWKEIKLAFASCCSLLSLWCWIKLLICKLQIQHFISINVMSFPLKLPGVFYVVVCLVKLTIDMPIPLQWLHIFKLTEIKSQQQT